jgi:hypothetical protein
MRTVSIVKTGLEGRGDSVRRIPGGCPAQASTGASVPCISAALIAAETP